MHKKFLTSYNPNDLLIFLHPVNTGGLTLFNAISRQFHPILYILGLITDPEYPFLYCNKTFPLDRPDSILDEDKKKGLINNFIHQCQNDQNYLNQIQVVSGHQIFGFHENVKRRCEYFTILREPVKRIVSIYNNYKSMGVSKFFPKTDNPSLIKFITDPTTPFHTNNFYTQYIAGNCPLDQWPNWSTHSKFNEATEETLEKAKHNLVNHFGVIGLTEYFDETIALLCKRYQWKNLYYINHSQFEKREPIDEVSIEVQNLIKEKNALDIELYRFAKELFFEQLQLISSELDGFLTDFHSGNNKFKKIYETARACYQPVKYIKLKAGSGYTFQNSNKKVWHNG